MNTKNLTQLAQILNSPIHGDVCPGSNKAEFKRRASKFLKELAKSMSIGEYDVRFNAGGPAVSGEAVLHTPRLYVQIFGGWNGKNVMFRACDGMKDYSGKVNHFTNLNEVSQDFEGFRAKLVSLVDKLD